jgi:hypothetical protein
MGSLTQTVVHSVLAITLLCTGCGSAGPVTDAAVADTGARTDGSAPTIDGGSSDLGACTGATFAPETSGTTPRVVILGPRAGELVRPDCTDGPAPVPTCVQVLDDPDRTVNWVQVQVSGQLGYYWLETQSSGEHRFAQGITHGGWFIGAESQTEGMRAIGNAEFFVGPPLTETAEIVFTLETMAGRPMCPVPGD